MRNLLLLLIVFIYWGAGSGSYAQSTKTTDTNLKIQLTVFNPSDIRRDDEIIELAWDSLLKKNDKLFKDEFFIVNALTNEQLPFQIIPSESGKPEILIFQVSLAEHASATIEIKKGKPELFKVKTFGRFVPERKDDFAWENDKIAFRMYGPALQASGEISNGMDVWVKRTPELILDKWYKLDKYHTDHGEGLDCYKVGPTLGAGGIAPVVNNKLFYSENFTTYKIITTGVLRTIFELTYKPWSFNGIEISEKKRISLDAGSNLNKVEITYRCEKLDTIPVAIGITKREGKGLILMNEKNGMISYWEPEQRKNGTTGVGIIVPNAESMTVMENHLAALASARSNQVFKYFQGAAWDKAGVFTNHNQWTQYLTEYLLKKQNPVIVKFK